MDGCKQPVGRGFLVAPKPGSRAWKNPRKRDLARLAAIRRYQARGSASFCLVFAAFCPRFATPRPRGASRRARGRRGRKRGSPLEQGNHADQTRMRRQRRRRRLKQAIFPMSPIRATCQRTFWPPWPRRGRTGGERRGFPPGNITSVLDMSNSGQKLGVRLESRSGRLRVTMPPRARAGDRPRFGRLVKAREKALHRKLLREVEGALEGSAFSFALICAQRRRGRRGGGPPKILNPFVRRFIAGWRGRSGKCIDWLWCR